jgi:TatA/E family protein of Tat protein translocase
MFGGWEILVLVLIVAVFFGYRYLPQLGRSAGEGARQLKEGAEEQAVKAKAYVDEHKPDPGEIGRTAGKHVREYRELKDEVMGTPKREESPKQEESEPEEKSSP